ncbi:MAG: TolC family protein [Muribaculaceae bacterium]
MKKLRTLMAMVVMMSFLSASSQLTLEQCRQMARDNYPLLKKYDLINATTSYNLSNLNKGYLPQLSLNAQATYQSDVSELPDALKTLMTSTGYSMDGLKRDQYRIGIDLSQVIYDGGAIGAQKEVARAEADVNIGRVDVDIYAIRERVDNLFFGVLLLDEQIGLNDNLQLLLADNKRKLEAMLASGTATQSDVDAVGAEYLNAVQQRIGLDATRKSYLSMLEIFIGAKIETPLEKPQELVPDSDESNRPELRLFDARAALARAGMSRIDAGIRPSLRLFAQGNYGYPGYDMFHDMMKHEWSLYGVVGVKLSWNIGNLYTHKNERRKLSLTLGEIESEREVFLFNNSLSTVQNRGDIDRYSRMLSQDDEIIALLTSVRTASEAKLSNGVIDVNDLLRDINRENNARINRSIHEVEMLRSISSLRTTLNQ